MTDAPTDAPAAGTQPAPEAPANAAPEQATSLSASEAFEALEKADRAKEPSDKETPAKPKGGETENGEENAEGKPKPSETEAEPNNPEVAPEVRDLSDLPDTAKVKFGDAEFSVADVKALQQRDVALTQRQVELDQATAKARELQQVNRDSLKSVADAAKARFTELAQNYEEAKKRFPEGSEGRLQYEAALQQAYDADEAASKRFEGVDKDLSDKQQAEYAEGLKGMAQYLMDPATGIKGYDQARHDNNSKFAASLGVPKEMLGQLTNGPAWRMIDMARRFAEGTKAAEATRATPSTKSAVPTIRSQGDNTSGKSAAADKIAKAEKAFKSSGSQADAIALLNARS